MVNAKKLLEEVKYCICNEDLIIDKIRKHFQKKQELYLSEFEEIIKQIKRDEK